MELKIKHIVLSAVFCLFSLTVLAQFQHPPEPMSSQYTEDPNAPVCPPVEYEEDANGDPVVVPPGLPCRILPIDDYLLPLLLAGLFLGGYRYYLQEKCSSSV